MCGDMPQTNERRPLRDGTRSEPQHYPPTSTSHVRIPAERSILARFSDPDTSHDAGNSQAETVVNARQVAVFAALHRYGPMTDEQIIARLDAMRLLDDSIPNSTAQAFRTARKALQVGGQVADTGRREYTSTGRTAIVWAATECPDSSC